MRKQFGIDTQAHRDFRYLFFLFGVIILGRILYFLFNENHTQGLVGLVGWLGVGILVGIETALYFGFGLVVLTDIWSWHQTIRLFGMPKWSVIKSYYWLATQMKNRLRNNLHGLLLVLSLFTFIGFIFSHRFTVLGLVCVGVMILRYYMQTLQPAAVLYLASSSKDRIALQAIMKRGNPTIRVVALLDVQEITTPGKSTDEWMDMMIGNDCLRTSDHSIWKEVVAKLSNHVPLIVLDARDTTSGVIFEIEHITREDLSFKTIFVVGSDGQAPLLQHFANEIGADAQTVVIANEQTISPLIRHLTRKSNLLPTKTRPIGIILRECNDTSIGMLATIQDVATQSSYQPDQYEIPKSNSIQTNYSVQADANSSAMEQSKTESLSTPTSRPTGSIKCSACGKWRPQGEWICPSCGHVDWFRIGIAFTFSLLFAIIGIFVTSRWWRWIWIIIALVLFYTALSDCIKAFRLKRRKTLSIRPLSKLNSEQFEAASKLLTKFLIEEQVKKDDKDKIN